LKNKENIELQVKQKKVLVSQGKLGKLDKNCTP